MSVYAWFLQSRHAVPIWLWPVLLYELCMVKAWAEAEATWRGETVEFLLAVDCWGRVYVQAVSDRPVAGVTQGTPFKVPPTLALDDGDGRLTWTLASAEPHASLRAGASSTLVIDTS